MVMNDIILCALHQYPRDWVDALQMTDFVKEHPRPDYFDRYPYFVDILGRSEVKGFLTSLITAQVAPNVWNTQDQKVTGAWASNGFSKQQELKDRCHYYLQAELDMTCLAANPGFHMLYEGVKFYHIGERTHGLDAYIEGAGGKSAGDWAKALYDYCVTHDDILRWQASSPRNRQVSKLYEFIGALTVRARSDSELTESQALPRNFIDVVKLGTVDSCRRFVASLPLADMQDLVSRQVELFWQKSEDETVNADVSGALKDCFEALGATTDVAATKDFQAKLVQFFFDMSGGCIYVSDRVEQFKETVIDPDYSTLNEKDLNRVKNLSTFLMLSLAISVANFGLSAKSTESWSDPDVDSAKITELGVIVTVDSMTSQAENPKDPIAGKLGETFRDYVSDVDIPVNSWDRNLHDSLLLDHLGPVRNRAEMLTEFAPPTTADTANAVGAGTGRASERKCFNWIEGAQESMSVAMTMSVVCLASSIFELITVMGLYEVQSQLVKAKTIVDATAIVFNDGAQLATFAADPHDDNWEINASDAAACLGIFGFVLVGPAVVLESVSHVLREDKPSPQEEYVDAVAPFLSSVAKPSGEWLRDHQIPDQ
jgi:hypothetical protein